MLDKRRTADVDDSFGAADHQFPESSGDSGFLKKLIYFLRQKAGFRIDTAIFEALKFPSVGFISQNMEFYIGISSAEHGDKQIIAQISSQVCMDHYTFHEYLQMRIYVFIRIRFLIAQQPPFIVYKSILSIKPVLPGAPSLMSISYVFILTWRQRKSISIVF